MEEIRIPMTITEAQVKSGYSIFIVAEEYTQSTSRIIPYADLYRSRTSIMETPAEYIQKASEDEEARKAELCKGHAG